MTVPTQISGTEKPVFEPPKKEVRIKVMTEKDWIIQGIEQTFPEEPRMVKVASCESGLVPDIRGTIDPDDCGIFQINQRFHGDRMEELGLSCETWEDNVKFARLLYDESGLQPWNPSASCWL